MAERRRGGFWWVGLAVAVGVALWLLGRDSEAARIVSRLDQFAAAVAVHQGESPDARRARIANAFPEVFTLDVVARVPDLPGLAGGRDALVRAAYQVGGGTEQTSLAFEQPNVRVDAASGQATVHARAAMSVTSAAAGYRTDNREIHLRLRKTERGWQVSEVVVAPPSTVEPEPRP